METKDSKGRVETTGYVQDKTIQEVESELTVTKEAVRGKRREAIDIEEAGVSKSVVKKAMEKAQDKAESLPMVEEFLSEEQKEREALIEQKSKQMSPDTFQNFIKMVGKLTTTEVIGLCRMMGISLHKNPTDYSFTAEEKRLIKANAVSKEDFRKMLYEKRDKLMAETPKTAGELMSETFDEFILSPRKKRREIMKILQRVTKGRTTPAVSDSKIDSLK